MLFLKTKLLAGCVLFAVSSMGYAQTGENIYVVQGTACSGAGVVYNTINFTPDQTGTFSLCVKATRPVCGVTYPFIATSAASDNKVQLTARRFVSDVQVTAADNNTPGYIRFNPFNGPGAARYAGQGTTSGVDSPGFNVDANGYTKLAEIDFVIAAGVTAPFDFTFNQAADVNLLQPSAASPRCGNGSNWDMSIEYDNVDMVNSPPATLTTLFSFVPVAATPSVSLACTPTTLFDRAAQVATCTATASSAAGVGGLSVNLTPPAANSRYSTSCGGTLSIVAGATTGTCTITATANTTPFDSNAVATLALATGAGYTLGAITSAAVTMNDDDQSGGGAPQAIPTMSEISVALLALLMLGATWMRRRTN